MSRRCPAWTMVPIVLLISSCQGGFTLGVRNNCGEPIEAVAEEDLEFPEGFFDFQLVEPGAVRQLVSISEDFEQAVAWVRAPGDTSRGRRVVVSGRDVPAGGDGETDYVLVIDGDLCP